MSINHVFAVFKKFRWLSAASVLVLTLAGCSSTMSRVQTWQGEPMEASRVAVLKVPGSIQVAQVNGRNMSNFLMDDLALDYELLPGDNQVVFTYKTIWAKSGVVRNGESKVHVVETAPQAVTFQARAGEIYRFDVDQPSSRQEAEVLAENFTARIVDNSGTLVAQASPHDPSANKPRLATRALASAGAGEAAAVAGGDLETLEALKVLWENASEDDKRAFLRWAFE